MISKNPQASWSSLPLNSEIRLLVKEIPLLATQSFNRDETALHFSQKVVQLLYKNDSNLSREVYVILLERLCETSYKVTKEVTNWLIYADDEVCLMSFIYFTFFCFANYECSHILEKVYCTCCCGFNKGWPYKCKRSRYTACQTY